MNNGNVENKSPWNSLEVVKLFASVLLPIAVLYVGASIKSQQDALATQRTKHQMEMQQQWIVLERTVKWRFDKYEQAAGLLNDMYIYFIYVGKWKELTPQDIIERKREVDKIFYSTGPLFSEALMARYGELIKEMFSHYQGWGEDAKLRSSVAHRKASSPKWDDAWNKRFTEEDNTVNIQAAYKAITAQLAVDLNLTAGR